MSRTDLTVAAPGRINILGEHTDYNQGYVLPAAINLTTVFKLTKNNTPSTVNFTAHNVNAQYTFDLRDFNPIEGTWENYVMGVVHELIELGASFSGFDAEFDGNVPIGSGMSSSAALECSLAYGLNVLFELGLDDWTLIKASQRAEHNFVGIKCGIMDQFASVMGKPDHAMLLDCMTLEFDYVPLDLGSYHFLLLNTNVTHALASSEYNKRRAECAAGLNRLKDKIGSVETLRDVTTEMLQAHKNDLDSVEWNRCAHVVAENNRVQRAVEALRDGDLATVGRLMYQSHYDLRDKYEVSCKELDFLVDMAEEENSIFGSRMMGGGFGGCTINLVEKKSTAMIVDKFKLAYQAAMGKELSDYIVTTGAGARVVV